MLIPNKRAILARGLQAAGVVRMLERRARRPGLLVLTYHRIGDPSRTSSYAPVVSATPEGFRAQMRRLRRDYRILTLDEVVTIAESGLQIDRPSALVTFDDGTRDNAEVAAPILLNEGVPAAFFLSTGLIDQPRLPWYDHIAEVVNRSTVPSLRLDRPASLTIDLTRTTRADAIARIVQSGLESCMDVNDTMGVLGHIEERAGVAIDPERLGQALFMSWDDARRLLESGMAMGSHAHSHRKLTVLSEAEQREELRLSKAILETRLGGEIQALAYPYGWAGTFDEGTERLAREAGYRVAFSAIEGNNRPGSTNPFALRRLNIGASDSPTMVRARLALQSALGRSPV
jgi:peptidoglycan/xylan/chitin deacetylase (PgdA/CDA1 family)